MDPYFSKLHLVSFCREIMWTKFYKTVNRGDRRLSISGIKQKAQINDLIAFNYKRIVLDNDLQENVIVINVTAKAENRKIA